MKKILIILAVVVVLMIFTCPSKQTHVDKITKVFVNVTEKAIEKETGDEDFGLAELGGFLTSTAVSTYLEENLDVKNYLIFNRGVISYKGEDKTISFGMFGQVITLNEKQAKEKLKSLMDDWGL